MSHLIGIVGLQGTGKSHFARSACVLGKTAVALTDPKEVSFYANSGAVVELFHDFDWRPHLGAKGLLAGSYSNLIKWLAAQGTTDGRYIVLDTGTEATRLAQHEALKMSSVFNPSELQYGRGYTGTDTLTHAMITEWRRLFARGKTVIVTFHGRMRELEGAGDPYKAKNMSGDLEWRFEEQMLPIIEGTNAMAQSIGSPFDLWLYTKPIGFGPGRQYTLTAIPDQVRPAKHSVTFKPTAKLGMLPNDLKALLEMLA